MKFWIAVGLVASLASSSKTRESSSSGSATDSTNGYSFALRQAAQDARLEESVGGEAAKDLAKDLGMDTATFATFQKLRKRHTTLMFIKDPNITADDRRSKSNGDNFVPESDPTPVYSNAVEFNFNADLLVTCQKFAKETGFHAINKAFFADIGSSDDGKRLYCGSIKFVPEDRRRVNRTRGDVAQVNLYLDSTYRPYGVDIHKYATKDRTTMVASTLDTNASVASRLDFVPYDVPNIYALSRMLTVANGMPKAEGAAKLSVPNDPYVQKQLSKRNVSLCGGQSAVQLTYDEKFGIGRQRVGWCKGDAWPSIIENDHYLAVLVAKP